MRFRFCGDLDCPDWILAEINSMARMSSIKMKLLCQQVAKSLLGDEIDYDKVKKLTADAKFETDDVKACLSALSFILISSCRYGVEEDALSNELQQLGMPKEHATALCKVHSDHMVPITDKLRKESLRFSVLEDVRYCVDLVPASTQHPRGQEEQIDIVPEVKIALKVKQPTTNKCETHLLSTTIGELGYFISELKQAVKVMEQVDMGK